MPRRRLTKKSKTFLIRRRKCGPKLRPKLKIGRLWKRRYVGDLYEFVDKFHAELLAAKAAVKELGKEFKSQQTMLNKVKTIAAKQLDLLKSLKIDLNEAK